MFIVIMTIIARKDGKKFETIQKTNFELEKNLQKLIVDDQIMKKIKLDFDEETTLVTLSREFESGSGPIDVLAIDEDGSVYIIETKLHGYADGRRKILAQIMDYAGAMWNKFRDFSTFEKELERHNLTSKDNHILSGKSLSKIISDSPLEITDEEDAKNIIEKMKVNFSSGNFKFIVVFDKLDQKLINTIDYLNEKSNLLTIYAVTYEYYRENDLEILIPAIHGRAAEKKSIVKSSGRTPWTLQEIKQNFEDKLSSHEYKSFKKLYQFLDENKDTMKTGNGNNGSIGPVFKKLCREDLSGSFLTLDAGGDMNINYPWIKSEIRKKIAESFSENPELKIDKKSRSLTDIDLNSEYPKYGRDQWSNNVDSIIETIRKFI
jgi:hypothetical protein